MDFVNLYVTCLEDGGVICSKYSMDVCVVVCIRVAGIVLEVRAVLLVMFNAKYILCHEDRAYHYRICHILSRRHYFN